jgi:multiple sugar transport system ATP-binding protein
MSQVKLTNIVKHYDDGTQVIHGIDLDIRDGEFVVFVGPSGCGKSTLLRMIAGLESITGGELSIGGKLANDIPPAKRGLAMVFQSYALYPHMSVYENMAFGLKLAGMKKAEMDAAVQQAATILQITHLLKRKPKDLSGGQRQRVAIGRAIVRKPEVFLFDEPLSNLDASLRVQMRLEISRLHQELNTTMIYVTHDQVEAMTLGERIVVFNGGHIEQVGSPLELYDYPANLFVAGFLGAPKMNFLPAQIISIGGNTVVVKLSDGASVHVDVDGTQVAESVQPGDQVTLGIRAEHLVLKSEAANPDNHIQVKVALVEHLGDSSIAYARIDGLSEMISIKQAMEEASLKSGDLGKLYLPAHRCHLFDKNGRACQRIRSAKK